MASYGHDVRRLSILGSVYYRLSWQVDYRPKGSRIRYPRTITRNTNKAGALRFCKKWKIAMPE